MLQVPVNWMTFLVFVALLALEDFRGEVNRLSFTTGEMNWLCREADNRQQENRKQRSRESHLTTIRRNSISPISGFTQEGAPIKRSHEFLVIKIRQGGQAEKQTCGPITGRDSSCYGHGNRNRSLVYFWRRARPAQQSNRSLHKRFSRFCRRPA